MLPFESVEVTGTRTATGVVGEDATTTMLLEAGKVGVVTVGVATADVCWMIDSFGGRIVIWFAVRVVDVGASSGAVSSIMGPNSFPRVMLLTVDSISTEDELAGRVMDGGVLDGAVLSCC